MVKYLLHFAVSHNVNSLFIKKKMRKRINTFFFAVCQQATRVYDTGKLVFFLIQVCRNIFKYTVVGSCLPYQENPLILTLTLSNYIISKIFLLDAKPRIPESHDKPKGSTGYDTDTTGYPTTANRSTRITLWGRVSNNH